MDRPQPSDALELLGGKDFLAFFVGAKGFGSDSRTDEKSGLAIHRSWFEVGGRLFIIHQGWQGTMSLVAFEYRPRWRSVQGILLDLILAVKPTTGLFREVVLLPCDLELLSPYDVKKIFKRLTGYEAEVC